MADPFRLSLFGGFRLERDGVELKLPRRKSQALLAYLALYPREHSREKLAALFWGDSTDADARRALRVVLTDLRQVFGPDAFLADRDTLQLNPDFPLTLDAREFLALTSTHLDFNSGAEIKNQKSNIENYLELLPDFYDDWLEPRREEFRALFLDAALKLIAHARTRGEYKTAIELAQKILTIDTANEAAHQHLMFCYSALGDRAAALDQYEFCKRALRDELGVEPSTETRQLYERIRQQSETGSSAARLTNLPKPLSSFVGREKQLRDLHELLTRASLVTLTGAGGSGKTRLAIHVASDSLNRYADGVWWVDFSALLDKTLVPQQVAKALGVQEQPNRAWVETLVHFLSAKQLLLVLDNCEHLVAACATLVESILSQCPGIRVLATSREALGVGGETIWQVPTMALPRAGDATQGLMRYEAIRLFVERAQAVNARFELTEQNAVAVTRICERLDGIPLALELAAARTGVSVPEEIAARLDDRFNLLTSGGHSVLPRQQTLRGLIDWSYDLLPDEERTLFRRLAVFAGGWTLEAATVIAGGYAGADTAPFSDSSNAVPSLRITASFIVRTLLQQLVNKSLLQTQHINNEIRYTVLETIREYACDKLNASNEMQGVHVRHADYFLKFAREAEPRLRSAGQDVFLQKLETEYDNLRAALGWSQAQADEIRGLQLANALTWFWLFRNYVSEGREWLRVALASGDPSGAAAERAGAFFGLGVLALEQGDLTTARNALDESIHISRDLGNNSLLAHATAWRGWIDIHQGSFDNAFNKFQVSLDLARTAGDQWAVAYSLSLLQLLSAQRLDFDAARAYGEQGVALFREIGDKWGLTWLLQRLGQFYYTWDRDFDRAQALLKESLSLARQWNNQKLIADTLWQLGLLAVFQLAPPRAERLAEQALALSRELQYREGIFRSVNVLGEAARVKGDFGRAATYYHEGLQVVREMDSKRAIVITAINLGLALLRGGDYAGAMKFLAESRANLATTQDKNLLATCLTAFGAAAVVDGRFPEGVKLLSAAGAQFEANGTRLEPVDQVEYDLYLGLARSQLDDTAFNAAWASGRALILEPGSGQGLQPAIERILEAAKT